MDKAVIIHTLNSLKGQFKPYLAILSHESREKKHLPSLEVLAKALEDKEMRLSNQDGATANNSKKEKKKNSKAKKILLPRIPILTLLLAAQKHHTFALAAKRPIARGSVGWTR